MSDNNFTEAELAAFNILVDMIIPASDEFAMPSAGDALIFTDILATAANHGDMVQQILAVLDDLALANHDSKFLDLSPIERDGLVVEFRQNHGEAASMIATIAVQCYYRDDRVMAALDMEVRPPFPKGFEVKQGDWSLLNPVRERQAFYRKTT